MCLHDQVKGTKKKHTKNHVENKGTAFAKMKTKMKWPVNPNHLIFKITLNIIMPYNPNHQIFAMGS